MFECVNFKDFVRILSAFGSRSTREAKLSFMFTVYDVDGDGACKRESVCSVVGGKRRSFSRHMRGACSTKKYEIACLYPPTPTNASTLAGLGNNRHHQPRRHVPHA